MKWSNNIIKIKIPIQKCVSYMSDCLLGKNKLLTGEIEIIPLAAALTMGRKKRYPRYGIRRFCIACYTCS